MNIDLLMLVLMHNMFLQYSHVPTLLMSIRVNNMQLDNIETSIYIYMLTKYHDPL
jgi:hypothetical protein